jgi:hypothetical protein
MKTLTQIQIRAFLRRWPLSLLGGLTILAVACVGAFESYLIRQPGVAATDALSAFVRYSIALPVIVAVVALESVGAPRLVGMQEAVDAHPDRAHLHWLAALVPSAVLAAAIFAVYVAFKLVALAGVGLVEVLAFHLLAEATLDILMPCVIGLLLGAFTATRLGRYAGYAVLALFVFIIGPYSELVPMLAQAGIADGGSGVNLYPAYDLLRILAPDPGWGMDALYGFPLEAKRWTLACFWILGLLALLLPTIAGRNTGAVRVLRASVAAVAIGCLLAALAPGSVLRRDYRFAGGSSIVSEQIYYQVLGSEHATRERAAAFTVDRYDMHLVAGRQLSATVELELSGTSADRPYCFTLYHGYHVEGVYGPDGAPLEFVQAGDYVTVAAPKGLRRITFKYRGSGGIYIANSQGVLLPGYFPYYPVPGFVRVWDDLRLAPVADIPNSRATRFSVKFDAGVPIASNLRVEDGVFEGRTAAPSFVGGLLAQAEVAGRRVVYYPASGVAPARLPGLIARVRDLERAIDSTRTSLPDGITVIQIPGLAQVESVALADTVFLSGFDESLAADVVVAGIPTELERENLKQAFTRTLSDSRSLDGLVGERPSEAELARLEGARLSARSDTERVQNYCNPAQSVVFWLFREKVREQGLDRALRETYRYLVSESTMSELQFLTSQGDTETQ